MLAQMFAVVAASEAVGAERDHAARQPRRDLVRHRLHVIGRGDDRAFRAFERLLNVGLLRRLRRDAGDSSVPLRNASRRSSL